MSLVFNTSMHGYPLLDDLAFESNWAEHIGSLPFDMWVDA